MAYFTREIRKAMPKGRVGFYYYDQPANYNEYGIRYYTDESEQRRSALLHNHC